MNRPAMELSETEALLKEVIGLDPETVGPSVVHYALRQRMAACQVSDIADYLEIARASRSEMQELINAVIVPETWFFRDRGAFAAMTGHLRANRRANSPISLLSLPCSTGEEPYSIVMAMFDAGFSPTEFRVDAVDVSTRNLSEAETAIYGRNSFRGADISFRDRYFEPSRSGFQPSARVRAQVRFRLGNIFEPSTTAPGEPYDVIFCRNLLIYFDRQMQERALDRLRQALTSRGLLLVGPAESSLPTLFGFTSTRQAMAFAFTKAEPADPAPVAEPPMRSRTVRSVLPVARPATPSPVAKPGPSPRRVSVPTPPPASVAPPSRAVDSLAAIEQAANAGRLEEAKRAAAAHLKEFGPSPAIFYLLGLAHDAGQELDEAIRNYRKALYLAPDHRETIAQLALLLQSRGDIAGAKALRSRLGRIEKRSGA